MALWCCGRSNESNEQDCAGTKFISHAGLIFDAPTGYASHLGLTRNFLTTHAAVDMGEVSQWTQRNARQADGVNLECVKLANRRGTFKMWIVA
jgi:hypothetical protein